jgi:predicted site-specific integrase-resolvase
MPETKQEELMTDAELCDLLRITPVTLGKYMREGPPRVRHQNAGDVRTIRHFTVGGQRRWVKSSVDEFIRGQP